MNHKWLTKRLAAIIMLSILAIMGVMHVGQANAINNPSEETVLFSDDFSGDLSEWTVESGVWYIENQQLIGSYNAYSSDGYIYAGDISWEDYSFQVKVDFIGPVAWFQFRSTENKVNEYFVQLWQGRSDSPNTYYVGKYQDGVRYDITDGVVTSPVAITSPSIIKVMVIDNHLYLFINDYFVFEYEDPDPLPNGRIGLGVPWVYYNQFDDVLVSTAPSLLMIPPDQEGYGKAGESVAYITELENHSGVTDSFNLEILAGNVWTTTLSSQQVGPIEDGEAITFTTWVDIPSNASPGDFDAAIIKAYPVASPSIFITTTLTTTAISADLAYVPMKSADALAVIDTSIHETVGTEDLRGFGCAGPERIKLNPDGTELYVMCESSKNIIVLNRADLSFIASIDHAGTCHQDITFVRFGRYALASSDYCAGFIPIDVIDTATHSIIYSIPNPRYEVSSIVAHPYLPLAYVAAYNVDGGEVLVIDTNSFTILTVIHFGGQVYNVGASPDGRWVYASDTYGGGLAKIDVETNTIVETLPDYGFLGMDISPDGSTIYSKEQSWGGERVAIIDAASMELITMIDVENAAYYVELNCNGTELYVSHNMSTVTVIDTQTNTIVDEISIPNPGSLYGLAICPQYQGRGAFLSPLVQSGYSDRGGMITYDLEMINLTGESDDFTLELLAGNNFTTTLSTNQIGPLPDHSSSNFSVSVEVPVDAQAGETDVATIKATSVLSPDVYSSTAEIHTSPTSGEFAYVTQSTNELTVIDRDYHLVLDTINLEAMGCIGAWRARLTPSGRMLFILCSESSQLIVLNVPELTLNFSLSYLSSGSEDDVVFSREEDYAFISARYQYNIQVVDILAQEMAGTIPIEDYGYVNSIELSPDGKKLYAAGAWGWNGRLYVVDLETYEVEATLDFGYDIWDVVVSPDNQRLYIGDGSWNGIAVVDVKTLEIVDQIQTQSGLTGLALSKDGTSIFAGRGESGYVDVYDLHNHGLLASIWVGGTVRDLAMDCKGEEMYVGSSTEMVSVINLETFNIDYSIPTPGNAQGVTICPQYQSNLLTSKMVDRGQSHPGATANYTITVSNFISETVDDVVITDTLPMYLTYREGTLQATSGMASYQDGVVSWTGSITASNTVTITFGTKVSQSTPIGTSITNEAIIDIGGQKEYRGVVIDIVPYRTYLPCSSHACTPDYFDDFSNPASGWAIESENGYWMGYDNGKYYIAVNQGWIAWSLLDFGVSDFRVEVDTWPGAGLNGASGIMFSATEHGFYLFEIFDGYYSLWRNDTDSWFWIPLIDWTYSPYLHPGNQSNRLGAVREGTDIRVYANGHLLGTRTDYAYHGTWIGMASEGYIGYFDGRFDNFSLFTGKCVGVNASTVPMDLDVSGEMPLIGPASGRLSIKPSGKR